MVSGEKMAAAIILAVSGLSDMADGFLARKFGWTSQTGKLLDPLADKLTQVSVCVVLMVYDLPPGFRPFFAFLLIKDVLMLVLGGYLFKKQVSLEGSKWFGKLTTVLFYFTTTLIVLVPGLRFEVVLAMLTLVVLSALIAGVKYAPIFLKYIAQRKTLND